MRRGLVTFIVCLFSSLSQSAVTTPAPAPVSAQLTPLQVKRIEQITSYFENFTVRFDYGYVVNLHDGRGFTVGRVGFCTGTGDAVQVVESYCAQTPHAPLCWYLRRLEQIDAVRAKHPENSVADVSGLRGFAEAWKLAAFDPNFRAAQDNVVNWMYLQPALKQAKAVGLKTPIARAIFYDTIVQQGEVGEDSLADNIQRTRASIGHRAVTELKWLNVFLDERRLILLNPGDSETQAAWADSIDRVDELKKILNSGKNYGLNHPIRIDDDDKKAQTD